MHTHICTYMHICAHIHEFTYMHHNPLLGLKSASGAEPSLCPAPSHLCLSCCLDTTLYWGSRCRQLELWREKYCICVNGLPFRMEQKQISGPTAQRKDKYYFMKLLFQFWIWVDYTAIRKINSLIHDKNAQICAYTWCLRSVSILFFN